MKSEGPKIDPYGTPEVIGRSFEFLYSIETNCFRLDKYERNQSFATLHIPYSVQVFSREFYG